MAKKRRLIPFFITGIERVIGAFDENLAPLDEAGREEGGHHADNHFLEKG